MSTAGGLLLLVLTASCCFCCYAAGLAAAPVAVVTRLPVLLVAAAGALLVLVQLARFCHQQLRMFRLTRDVPGPSPTWPLLGNALDVYVPQKDIMEMLMGLRERCGPTFRIWAGPFLAIFCSEPEDLQVIFAHQHLKNKGSMYDVLNTILDEGLLTQGSSNDRHRKALMPSFHKDIIRSFIPAFALEGRNLVKAMKHLSHSGDTFNIIKLTEVAVSRVTCETLLGSADEELMGTLGDDIRTGAELMMFLLLRPWFGGSELSCRLLAPGIYKEKQRIRAVLDGLVRRAVESKEEQLRDENRMRGEKYLKDKRLWTAEEGGRVKDLLEHVLTSKEGALIDRDELVGDLKHLLTGGIVSVADLLAFFMLALAMTPDAQDKVHQELDEVFADDPNRPVTAADLPRLRYLEMAIKETLRYFPVIPIYARNAADDVTLPSGTVVPRGSTVVILPKTVQCDPRWYPDPNVFDPDRHRPEVADARPNFTYIPFSAGVRGCIGQRFAMLLSKTIAATVLREYRFLPAPGGAKRLCDLKLIIGVAMHLDGGVNIRVERR